MSDLGPSLEAALRAGPVPTSGPQLVAYAGGRVQLARELSGMPGPPNRSAFRDQAAYEAARRRWRSASRRAQRYAGAGGQRRAPRLTPVEKRRVRRPANTRKRDRVLARGLRARLRARVLIPSPKAAPGRQDDRMRTMPSGGPGVYLDPDTVRDVLDAQAEGEGLAADLFLGAFLEAYGMPVDTDLEDVMWLTVWPEGTPEP